MKRDIENDLLRWKQQSGRMPLLLRGARQVGKSYIIEKFGKTEFENYIVLNFEQHPEYQRCFDTLEPLKIINTIQLLTGHTIEAGKTLLFLDEIQECPQAIMALRYFKEQMPDLHVIGAGSLLEFVLNDSDFRMPVGRVQFMYMRPLSFGEYLTVSGNDNLRSHLRNLHLGNPIESVLHEKLLSIVREYVSLGGMPAVVAEYLESKNLQRCQEMQTAILTAFRSDFGKYAKYSLHEHLQTIFAKAPGLVGKWIKYSKIDSETSTFILKKALKKLCDAGLIILVYATSGAGLPFVTHMNEKKFKLLFLDIGLVKRACNLDLELIFKKNLFLINEGLLAEQFVGQELLTYTAKEEANSLFFWTREQIGSSAEVDYLLAVDSKIVPIEVKSKAIGSLRSLKLFMSEKKISSGVRVSENPLSFSDNVLSIPFYLIEELPRLIKELDHV